MCIYPDIEIHIINAQMMRIQRYDQCGEYIDGADVQVSVTLVTS